MHQVEAEDHDQPRPGILYIHLHADRGCRISHDRFGDAEQTQGLMRERVLKQSDQASRGRANDLVTTRHGEKYRHQQWQIEEGEEREPHRQRCLQVDSDQRHQQPDRPAEAVNLDTFTRARSSGHGQRLLSFFWTFFFSPATLFLGAAAILGGATDCLPAAACALAAGFVAGLVSTLVSGGVASPLVSTGSLSLAESFFGTEGRRAASISAARMGTLLESAGAGSRSASWVTTRTSSSLARFTAGFTLMAMNGSLSWSGATLSPVPTGSPLEKTWSPPVVMTRSPA